MTLDKNISIPLYCQLKEHLAQTILEGPLAPGSLLPSERELSEQYGISRMTVRQALGELVKEGLLVREQGKGTYVASPKINQGLLKLTSFSEDMKSRGFKPDSHIRAVYEQGASARVANALGLRSGDPVLVMERVRLADQQPMALEVSHLPVQRFPNFDRERLLHVSLYTLLEEQYQISITMARQTIEVGLSNAKESETLGIRKKSTVLRIERTTFDEREQPFEFVRSVYRGDRYKFQVELHR